jgi:hypothetical protein
MPINGNNLLCMQFLADVFGGINWVFMQLLIKVY